uniref:Envelope fusion protein n=2 Tax=Cacopsylla melanoneura TaxID=428564 RepID=A0A8D8SXH9_9HEMI
MNLHLTVIFSFISVTSSLLLFEKVDEVLVEVDSWHLVLDINYDHILDEQLLITELVQDVNNSITEYRLQEWNAKMYFNTSEFGILKEFNNIVQRFSFYQKEVNSLLSILPKIKQKRGLIDLGGTLLNKLFGVMDSDDRKDIDNRIKDIESQNTQIIFDSTKQLTILKNLNSVNKNNTQTINQIVDHLAQYDKVIQSIYVEKYRDFNLTFLEIENYLNGIFMLKNIDICIDSAIRNINKFKQGLNYLFLGRVTSDILPEEIFFDFLTFLSSNLNKSLYLPYPVVKSKLMHFYNVVKDSVIIQNNKLILILEIPLLDDNYSFDLYEISYLPIFHPESKRFVVEESKAQYLAVNPNQTKFFYLDKLELNACHNILDSKMICKEHVIRYVKNSSLPLECIWNNFANLSVDHNPCNLLVLNTQSNLYVNTHYDSIYYSTTDQPINITFRCIIFNNTKLELVNSSLTISNVGQLSNAKGCKLLSENFEFIIESNFISKFKLTLPTVKKIDISFHLKHLMNETIPPLFNDSIVMAKFDNSAEFAINDLMQHYSEIQYKNENSATRNSISLGFLLFIFAIAGIIITIVIIIQNKIKMLILTTALELRTSKV